MAGMSLSMAVPCDLISSARLCRDQEHEHTIQRYTFLL